MDQSKSYINNFRYLEKYNLFDRIIPQPPEQRLNINIMIQHIYYPYPS